MTIRVVSHSSTAPLVREFCRSIHEALLPNHKLAPSDFKHIKEHQADLLRGTDLKGQVVFVHGTWIFTREFSRHLEMLDRSGASVIVITLR